MQFLVGRPGNISADEYEREFIKHERYLEIDGQPAKYTSNVFDIIAKDLGTNRKTVYMAFTRYLKKSGKNITQKSIASPKLQPEEIEKETDGEYTLGEENLIIEPQDIKLDLNISGLDLFSDNDGSNLKKQSEWSDTFNEIVWEFARLPCAWSLSSKTVANEKVVFGKCRSTKCKANLIAHTENNASKLCILIKDVATNAIHLEKRKVRGANKERIVQMLQLNKTGYVHAELADEILQQNDFEAAHLPNPTTLRKMIQNYKEKSHRDINSIISLCMMKGEATFNKCIGDIGIDPFYCFFATPEQKEWLRLCTRFKRCVISVDSTGKF